MLVLLQQADDPSPALPEADGFMAGGMLALIVLVVLLVGIGILIGRWTIQRREGEVSSDH